MVIIGLLVSMASINTNHDKRADVLKSEALRLKFFLEAASDEAMLQNKNIGFEVSRFALTPYELKLIEDPQTLNKTYSWQNYEQGRVIKYLLTEGMALELSALYIDGSEMILPLSPSSKPENVEPQFMIYADGQQDISKFQISINDYNALAKVSGSGLGRFYQLVEIDNE